MWTNVITGQTTVMSMRTASTPMAASIVHVVRDTQETEELVLEVNTVVSVNVLCIDGESVWLGSDNPTLKCDMQEKNPTVLFYMTKREPFQRKSVLERKI